MYDYTRIKPLRSRGRLLAEGLDDGACALVERAFFDPALGFLQFQPGQPLEFLLELLGCDQEFWVGWAAGSMAQLLRVVGLKDQVAAGFEGGNGAPCTRARSSGSRCIQMATTRSTLSGSGLNSRRSPQT